MSNTNTLPYSDLSALTSVEEAVVHAATDNLFSATNDEELVQAYLRLGKKSHKGAVLKFYSWMKMEGLQLSQVLPDHIIKFVHFSMSPPKEWVGTRRPMHINGEFNPHWRPYTGAVSPASMQTIYSILGTFFLKLVRSGYLQHSPTLIAPSLKDILNESPSDTHEAHHPTAEPEKYLCEKSWEYILRSLEILPSSTSYEKRLFQRAKLILIWGYYTGGRATEITQLRGYQVQKRFNETHQQSYWWWHFTGKGGIKRKIPVHQKAIDQLHIYMSEMGFDEKLEYVNLNSGEPEHEFSPLLPSIKNKSRSITYESLRATLQPVFTLASGVAREMGDVIVADKLLIATPHWLRHTFATNAVKAGANLKEGQLLMGHKQLETFGRYLHVDDDSMIDRVHALD